MNEFEWGFCFDQAACIQCFGCEAACKMWRQTEAGIKWRRVLNVWHGAYPDVTCSAVSLSCQHCHAPACADVCPVSAISKQADGLVRVDRDVCIGCQACLDACPYDVPQYGADGLMQKCDLCTDAPNPDLDGTRPPCVVTCPTRALTLIHMTADEKRQTEQDILKSLK